MSSQVAEADSSMTNLDAGFLRRAHWKLGGVVLGLALIGLALTGYLSLNALGRGTIAGCGAGSACDMAMGSAWAWWLGVPVSALAAGVYVLILAATLTAMFADPRVQRLAWVVLPTLALVLAGAAAWFIYVLLFRVGAMCPWCTASHLVGLATAGMIVGGAVGIGAPAAPRRRVGPAQWALAVMLAAAGLAVLIGTQILRPTPTYAMVDASALGGRQPVEATAAHSDHNHDSHDEDGHDHEPLSPEELQRQLEQAAATADEKLLSGRNDIYGQFDGRRVIAPAFTDIVLDPHELPMIGSPDAKHLLVFFFDYTCETCRRAHSMLRRVHETFGDQIGVLLVPWPASGLCNPVLAEKGLAGREDSCRYARLGLALWRVGPQVFERFDQWLSRFAAVPPVDVGVKQAIDLAGRERLEAALKDPWVDAQLQQYIQLTRPVIEHFNVTPVILMERQFMQGVPEDVEAFCRILEDRLGVVRGRD